MKIVCDSCQAKYSIADEKIVGKVFKIRCKRCGNSIVVRTDEQGAAPAAAGAGEAIWHVVVQGEQHGPYDPAQLAEMLTAGTVDWEAYVWCEGFENWIPMRDVADLVAQITGQGQAETAVPLRASAVMSYSTPPSMGADPFADDAGSASSPFDAPALDAGPDLFGPASQSGRFDKPAAAAAAAAPIAQDQSMTGQRNENSVLFSLKNLQALATGSSPSHPPPSSTGGGFGGGTAGGGGPAGFATGEGSGLIDIRALASATGIGASGGAGEKDDLLSMGAAHQGGAFGALGSPMLAPVATDEGSNRKVIVWASVAAVAFLSVAAVAIVYILRPQPGPAPAPVVSVPTPAVAAPAAPAPAPVAPAAAPAAPASEGALAAAAAAAAPAAAPADNGEAARKKRAAGGGGTAAKPAASADDDLLSAKDEPAKPAAPKGPRSIDDLLDNALEGKSAPKAAAAAGGGGANLPENPSRDDVMRAMNDVKSGVQTCAQGQSGVAIVNVTVAGATGRVTAAQVEGITGPAGSCIAREVRKATFPKFKNATFKVKYPYRL